MNLSGKEHKERQEKLIESARNFVGYIDSNLGTGIVRLEALSEQIGKLSNTNGHLLDCYGIMTDAASAAGKANLELAKSFDKPAVSTAEGSDEPVQESMMAQRTRQKNGLAVKAHIGDLTRLGTATGQTFGQLMQQSSQLQVMREKNENQIGEARQMRSAGSAAVADNLVTVLQAINNAALGEVTANTHTYMTRMNDGTRKVLRSEFMGLVVDQVGANNRAMQELEAIAEAGNIVNETNGMLRRGMQEARQFTTELSQETARLRETLDGFATLQAEVNAGEDTAATPVPATATSKAQAPAGGIPGLSDPFSGLGGPTRAPYRGPVMRMM